MNDNQFEELRNLLGVIAASLIGIQTELSRVRQFYHTNLEETIETPVCPECSGIQDDDGTWHPGYGHANERKEPCEVCGYRMKEVAKQPPKLELVINKKDIEVSTTETLGFENGVIHSGHPSPENLELPESLSRDKESTHSRIKKDELQKDIRPTNKQSEAKT